MQHGLMLLHADIFQGIHKIQVKVRERYILGGKQANKKEKRGSTRNSKAAKKIPRSGTVTDTIKTSIIYIKKTRLPTSETNLRDLEGGTLRASLVSWPKGFSNSFATSFKHQMLSKSKKERIGPAIGDRVKTMTYLIKISCEFQRYMLPRLNGIPSSKSLRAIRQDLKIFHQVALE